MVVSATGTNVAEYTAKQRIRNIIDNDAAIKREVDATIAKLDSKNLAVLSYIDADPNLTPAEKDAEKDLKKRELAILSVYITNQVFQQKVLNAL